MYQRRTAPTHEELLRYFILHNETAQTDEPEEKNNENGITQFYNCQHDKKRKYFLDEERKVPN